MVGEGESTERAYAEPASIEGLRPPDVARQAAAAARSCVGAARAEMRVVLARRLSEQQVPLSAPLPAHPRLAPGPHAAGPRR